MCRDIKLKTKLKNERFQHRKEFRDFYTQYGYEKLEFPTLKKRRKQNKLVFRYKKKSLPLRNKDRPSSSKLNKKSKGKPPHLLQM